MRKYALLGASAIALSFLAHCVSDGDNNNIIVTEADGSADGASGNVNDGSTGVSDAKGSSNDAPSTSPCAPSPLNFDVPGNNCDDDGDGTVDNTPTCDSALNSSGDGEAFARALGICGSASASRWGLVSATYTAGYLAPGSPNDAQHAILPKYGNIVHPLEGVSLGVLSSGFAALYDDSNDAGTPFSPGTQMQGTSTDPLPTGFPVAAPGCPTSNKTFDTIDLALHIQVPANATKLDVSFDFHSSEWPAYVCTEYNDTFIIYYNDGASNPVNIAFDAKSNPINVNSAFMDRCTNGIPENCGGTTDSGSAPFPCGAGPSELGGTGFGELNPTCTVAGVAVQSTQGASSGWRTATVAVKGGSTISLDIIISDVGDSMLDSSVLLDNLHWEN